MFGMCERNQMKQQIKPKWLLCQNCIDALASRGEKPYVGKMISQDDDEPLKCDWCEEEVLELYECI